MKATAELQNTSTSFWDILPHSGLVVCMERFEGFTIGVTTGTVV